MVRVIKTIRYSLFTINCKSYTNHPNPSFMKGGDYEREQPHRDYEREQTLRGYEFEQPLRDYEHEQPLRDRAPFVVPSFPVPLPWEGLGVGSRG